MNREGKAMAAILDLYHGSSEIIRKPEYGAGRRHNDYGLGFYCTENEELAREWACSSVSDGFSNHYELDLTDLNVLDLNGREYSILNWITVLVDNRLFRPGMPVAGRAKRYLEEHFSVNVKAYDIVRGYRADDAYYDFADAFLNNAITVEQLARAMKLGKLGEQVVLKSKRAFETIRFVDYEKADRRAYYPVRKSRSESAELAFRKISEEDADGLYMIDIMRKGVRSDDPRIPRNLP